MKLNLNVNCQFVKELQANIKQNLKQNEKVYNIQTKCPLTVFGDTTQPSSDEEDFQLPE